MFSGIVEEAAKVVKLKKDKSNLHITMHCSFADELKIVVFNKSDFEWAEKYASLVSPTCKLYLQPEWDKATEITPLLIDYIKANPKWDWRLDLP